MLAVSLCMATAAMATKIGVNDKVEFIAYNKFNNTGIMKLSNNKCGPQSPIVTAWVIDLADHGTNKSTHHSWGTQLLDMVDKKEYGVQNQFPNQVPEPATLVLLLLGLGLVVIASLRWQFRK